MIETLSTVVGLMRHPTRRTLLRYSAISVASFLVTVMILGLAHDLLRWSAFSSNMAAWLIVTAPAYQVTRRWAWSQAGRGHIWREVTPFWVLAAVGLGVSTWWAVAAESIAHHQHWSRSMQTVVVEIAVVVAYGFVWIGRYVVFNRYVFVHAIDRSPQVAVDNQVGQLPS